VRNGLIGCLFIGLDVVNWWRMYVRLLSIGASVLFAKCYNKIH